MQQDKTYDIQEMKAENSENNQIGDINQIPFETSKNDSKDKKEYSGNKSEVDEDLDDDNEEMCMISTSTDRINLQSC